jgi:hypothetical protein
MHCQNSWGNEDNQFAPFVIFTVATKQLAEQRNVTQ